jgi:hypothetical protein
MIERAIIVAIKRVSIFERLVMVVSCLSKKSGIALRWSGAQEATVETDVPANTIMLISRGRASRLFSSAPTDQAVLFGAYMGAIGPKRWFTAAQ